MSSIDFCPNEPYDYYVASGIRINRYSGASNQITGSITKPTYTPLCMHMRRDGQLLASGDSSGEIKVKIGGFRSYEDREGSHRTLYTDI